MVGQKQVDDAKKTVIKAALGIKALSDEDLCKRLEEVYWQGYKAGSEKDETCEQCEVCGRPVKDEENVGIECNLHPDCV